MWITILRASNRATCVTPAWVMTISSTPTITSGAGASQLSTRPTKRRSTISWPRSAERISLHRELIQPNLVFTSETDRDVKTSRGDLSLMPRGASRALEEARRARANEVLRVIHGNPGQIIGQKRRTAMNGGCPDRHLLLYLAMPASRALCSAGARSDQTAPRNERPIPLQSHRF